jgi:hypothetical protein
LGLFHERSHRQAINEAARPLGILEVSAIPKPRERDSGSLAEASRYVNELRMAIRTAGQPFVFGTVISFTTRKATLVVVGCRLAGGGLKKVVESKPVHNSPPSRHVDARCLVIDGLC